MSKSVILKNEKRKFMHILTVLNEKSAKVFTQQEKADCLKISRRKLIDFENGKIFDFWLLCRYADLVGESISFWISGTLE